MFKLSVYDVKAHANSMGLTLSQEPIRVLFCSVCDTTNGAINIFPAPNGTGATPGQKFYLFGNLSIIAPDQPSNTRMDMGLYDINKYDSSQSTGFIDLTQKFIINNNFLVMSYLKVTPFGGPGTSIFIFMSFDGYLLKG